MTQFTVEKETFRRVFLLLLVVAISVSFFKLIGSFVMALLLAGIFSGLLHPLYRKLLQRLKGSQFLASATTLVIALVVVVVPLLGLLGIIGKEAYEMSQKVRPWIEQQIAQPLDLGKYLPEPLQPLVEKVRPYSTQFVGKLGELAGKAGSFLVDSLSATTKGTANFFLQLFVMLYAMYFFLISGGALLKKIFSYFPLPEADEERLVDKFISVTRATIKGNLIIGLIQGGLGGLGFAVAGLQGATFWATIMAVLSVIPGVGTALVWVPAVIYLLATGRVVAGIGLLVWCVGVVGTIDNVLRPRLVGKDAKLPDLLILLSTLGGIAMYGIAGFIIGPIIAALFVTVWDIYRTAFQDVLLPAEGAPEPTPEPAPGEG